jgi:cytoskeletal protein CcmA (bactofilin family)
MAGPVQPRGGQHAAARAQNQRVERRVTEDQRRKVAEYIDQEHDRGTEDIEYLRREFEKAVAYGRLGVNDLKPAGGKIAGYTAATLVFMYILSQARGLFSHFNEDNYKVGLDEQKWTEKETSKVNLSLIFDDHVKLHNITVETVEGWVKEILSNSAGYNNKTGLYDEGFNASLVDAFLFDGSYKSTEVKLHAGSNSTLEFIVSTNLTDCKLMDVKYNGTINDATGELNFKNNTYIDGDFNATVNLIIEQGKVSGTAALNDLNLTINGGLSGTANLTLDAYIEARMENVTLNDAILNATLDNVSLQNGFLNAYLANTTVNGSLEGKLDNATITGSIEMTGAEFRKFWDNVTLNGTGTVHYGNGDVQEDINANFNTSGIKDNDTIKLDFGKDVQVTGDILAAFKNAMIDGNVYGNITADLAGGIKGTIYDGKINGWVNGTMHGNANGTIYADIVNGTASGSGTIDFDNTVISGYTNGTWNAKNVTLYVHGGMDITSFNAKVAGDIWGNLTGRVDGTAKSNLINLWLEGDNSGTLDAKLQAKIDGVIHRAALNANMYAKLQGEGYLQGYASMTGEVITDEPRSEEYGYEGLQQGAIAGLVVGVGLAGRREIRNAHKRAIHEEAAAERRTKELGDKLDAVVTANTYHYDPATVAVANRAYNRQNQHAQPGQGNP